MILDFSIFLVLFLCYHQVYNDVTNGPFIQTFKFLKYDLLICVYQEEKEGRKEGITEEKERREIQMAIEMLEDKEPIEKIVKYSHLTVEQIEELSKQIL